MTEPIDSAPGDKVASEAAAPPLVPDHQLIRNIGGGSSGQVWLARNALGTYRAVKIVFEKSSLHKRPFGGELDGVMKFEPISRQHDGLVDILHVGGGEAAGCFYCVMELADDIATGQNINPEHYRPRTLERDLAERKHLPIGECIRLGATIASALGFLHRHGLIHRDIKPSNIIFVNGFPKLADTGLVAEMFEPSSYVGTEGFIAPEGPGTRQADIYSLGKVLYEISTGRDRNDYPELPAHLEDNREGRDLIQFNKIVVKACRTNPGQRYKSADELMTALLTFQFCRYDPHREKTRDRLEKLIEVGGICVAIGVFAIFLWRIIWLLLHGQ
ncbi:MAG: serine/threonine-protein kinase [Verrucomicrobiota bacterium]|jgi:serine/threonine protein kinase